MAETKIEWADYTFNPWIGCTKVSPACAHCYAERDFDHRYGKVKWGPNGTRVLTSDANWKEPIKWERQAAREFGLWSRNESLPKDPPRRKRVFCASLADVFEDWDGEMKDHHGNTLPVYMQDVRNRLFDLIDDTPNLDWLLLTKRPENIARMWTDYKYSACASGDCPHEHMDQCETKYRENVWLGCSVESSDYLHRIDSLKAAGGLARFLFLSMEPVVGPMPTLGEYLDGIDWVIAGGESGPKARPSHVDWFRSIRDQCAFLEVPFLFKQWGEWLPFSQATTKEQIEAVSQTTIAGKQSYYGASIGWGWQELKSTVTEGVRPEQINMVGKSIAGRMLDGRFHDEFPG